MDIHFGPRTFIPTISTNWRRIFELLYYIIRHHCISYGWSVISSLTTDFGLRLYWLLYINTVRSCCWMHSISDYHVMSCTWIEVWSAKRTLNDFDILNYLCLSAISIEMTIKHENRGKYWFIAREFPITMKTITKIEVHTNHKNTSRYNNIAHCVPNRTHVPDNLPLLLATSNVNEFKSDNEDFETRRNQARQLPSSSFVTHTYTSIFISTV